MFEIEEAFLTDVIFLRGGKFERCLGSCPMVLNVVLVCGIATLGALFRVILRKG